MDTSPTSSCSSSSSSTSPSWTRSVDLRPLRLLALASFFGLALGAAACAAAAAEDPAAPPNADPTHVPGQPSEDPASAEAGSNPSTTDDTASPPSTPKDAGTVDAANDGSTIVTNASCGPFAPGVYHVTMVRIAGTGVGCFDHHETTIDLTPDGIADAAAQPPPAALADAGGTCTSLPSPTPCTTKLSCITGGTTFESTSTMTHDPVTGVGTMSWTMVYPDGGILLDCTWSATWTKL